jgi:subfamily B ATP-binding cassette protein MsbA
VALYRRLLSFLRPHTPAVVLAAAAAAVYAVLDATVYVLLIPFVDALFLSGAPSDSAMQGLLDATVYRWVDLSGSPLVAIDRIIVLMIFIFLLKNIFAFTRAYFLARAEQGVNRDLRNAVYDHLVDLDLGFFGRVRTGQIVSRLTTEIEQLRELVTKEMSGMISAVLEFMVALLFMVLISWKLTLAAFVVIPAAMGIWGPLVKVLRRCDRRVLHLGGEVNAHILETLAGIRLVKSASAEERERRRFHRLTGDYFRHFMRAEFARALAAPMTEMLAAAGTVILLWYGARLVGAGDMTGAQFVGFLGLSLKLYAPVKKVAKFPATAQPGLVAAERVFEFLDAPIEITDSPDAEPIRGFEREIVFEDVSFEYRAGEAAVSDVSFTVRGPWSPSSVRAGPARAPWSTSSADSSTCWPARSESTATTSVKSRSATSARSWASCRKRPYSSTTRFRRISLTGAQGPAERRSKRRPPPRTPTASSCRCPRATTPWSANAGCSCPEGSGKGSPSRVRCCATLPF